MINSLPFIKAPTGDMDFSRFSSEIAPRVKRIYSPGGADAASKLLDISKIEFISDQEAFSDDFYLLRIKSGFNCLKENGDILFFGDDCYLCSIPHNYAELIGYSDALEELISKSPYKKELEYLMLYSITKDLKYLDLLSKTETPVPFEAFDLCRLNTPEAYGKISGAIENGVRYSGALHNAEEDIKKRHENRLLEIQSNIEGYNGKKKNIIIMHLESLSNEIYFNNRDKLESLTSLFDSSMNFTRFYSSASSSIMSLFDLFYGNDFETDNYTNFKELYPESTYSTHLFQILKNNGYNTLGIGFNEPGFNEETNSSNVWNVEGQKYIWKESFDEFLDGALSFISQNAENGTPFALHMWDLLTHLGHFDEETKHARLYDRKIALSFMSLNIMVEKTLSLLNTLGLLDDTVIICYGDHGDDLWTRGINNGFTHVLAPHSNLIWNPACIYDKRIGSFLFNNIASTIDLKSTALYLLGIEFEESFPHHGINLIKQKNGFIYSRSLFHNQREYQRIANHKMIALHGFSSIEENEKAFSIISDKYNLIAGAGGLELYLYLTDAFNRNNLLNFIEFDGDFVPVKLNNYRAWRGHFRKIMINDYQIYEIICNLNLLCAKLKDRIYIKNSFITNEEKNLLDMERFKKVNKRNGGLPVNF